MAKREDYQSFKLNLVEKTYELYVKRLDVWEDQFFKIKYGSILIITGLLGFRYTFSPDEQIISYLALACTLGLWIFEATLRTTFFRYIAKMDILTETINNSQIMLEALKEENLDIFRILDFDIRMKALRDPLTEYVKIAHPKKSVDEQKKIVEEIIAQKRKLSSLWSSLRLKNAIVFYSTLVVLQVLALIFFVP